MLLVRRCCDERFELIDQILRLLAGQARYRKISMEALARCAMAIFTIGELGLHVTWRFGAVRTIRHQQRSRDQRQLRAGCGAAKTIFAPLFHLTGRGCCSLQVIEVGGDGLDLLVGQVVRDWRHNGGRVRVRGILAALLAPNWSACRRCNRSAGRPAAEIARRLSLQVRGIPRTAEYLTCQFPRHRSSCPRRSGLPGPGTRAASD